MSRASFGVLALVVGCGSSASTAPPKGPESETPTPAEAATNAPESQASAPKAEPEPAAPAEAKEPETLSPADLTSVLQAVLGDPELDGYLHLEKPGRSPVKLSGPDLPKDLKLTKGKYGVVIVDGPKSPKDPVIVLTRIKLEDKTATVAYQYSVEGIVGTTRVTNGKSGWELKSSRILEK